MRPLPPSPKELQGAMMKTIEDTKEFGECYVIDPSDNQEIGEQRARKMMLSRFFDRLAYEQFINPNKTVIVCMFKIDKKPTEHGIGLYTRSKFMYLDEPMGTFTEAPIYHPSEHILLEDNKWHDMRKDPNYEENKKKMVPMLNSLTRFYGLYISEFPIYNTSLGRDTTAAEQQTNDESTTN